MVTTLAPQSQANAGLLPFTKEAQEAVKRFDSAYSLELDGATDIDRHGNWVSKVRDNSGNEVWERNDAVGQIYTEHAKTIWHLKSHDPGDPGFSARFDSDSFISLVSRALTIIDKIYWEPAPEMRFGRGEVIPMKPESRLQYGGPIMTFQAGYRGQLERTSRNADQGNLMGEEIYKKFEFPTQFYGGGYVLDFWDQDLYNFVTANEGSFLSQPVNFNNPAQIKQKTLTQAYEQKLNDLVKVGDPSVGIQGFINHRSSYFTQAPYAVNADTEAQEDYKLLQIVARGLRPVWGDNIIDFQPNTLVMSEELLYEFEDKLYTTANSVGGNVIVAPQSMTVMDKFRKSHPHITRIIGSNELNKNNLARLGLPNENVIIALRSDPEKIYFAYSPWRNHPPIQIGGRITRYGSFATAGVILPTELCALSLNGWRVPSAA